MTDKILFSIITPVYRSSSIIPELIQRVSQQMIVHQYSYEHILIDDGSGDGSWDIIEEACKRSSNVKGVRLKKNNGQLIASLAGMSFAKGRLIVTIDDDLEYDPADIIKLYNKITGEDLGVVFGLEPEKYETQGHNHALAHFRNRLFNFIWQKPVTDSFKILKRELIFDQDRFLPVTHFEAYIKHHISPKQIGYVKVSYHKRFTGTSNYTLSKTLKLLRQHGTEYYRGPKHNESFDIHGEIAEKINLP